MDVRDTPTIVCLDGKPVSMVVKNRHAKTLAIMFKKTGYNESQISFQFPPKNTSVKDIGI